MTTEHYKAPGWFTRNVFNKAMSGLTRLGVDVLGSRVLEVPGRKSGEIRTTPVNLLELDGHEYLVSPRGEGQWVRNVRANDGRLALVLGRKRTDYVATAVEGEAGIPVLRAYLKRWKFEVGQFFDGVDANSSDDELAAVAPKHPIFRLTPAPPPVTPGDDT
jgi:deazaflavin-dependent oxidoreductase (nitroreductase family)